MFRFSWVMIDPQEQQILLEGMDFVELAADGRLQRITCFFGAFPPIPDSWCGAAGNPALEDLKGRGCYVIVSSCPYSLKCVEEEFCEVRIAPVPFRKGALAPHVSLPDKTSGTYYGSPVDQTHWTGAAIRSRK